MTITEVLKDVETEKVEDTVADDPMLKEAEELARKIEDSEKELDDQLAVFEPIGRVVERTIKHPNGTEKTFIQKEFSFMTKIRFLRLMSGTIRLAAEAGGTSISGIIQDTFGDIQQISNSGFGSNSEDILANQFISTVINLVELAPDFLEELFLIALEVPRKEADITWALEAFETIDDDEGFAILDTVVAQNSKAIKDFFTERLVQTAKRGQAELNIKTDTQATE